LSDLRQGILTEIRRLADRAGGRPPGQTYFESETGISQGKWRGVYWARWGDALKEAGFEPNEWTSKKDTKTILEKFAELTLELGSTPTKSEIDLMRRQDNSVPSSKHIIGHFGSKNGLAKALLDIAASDDRFSALTDIVVVEHNDGAEISGGAASIDGWVYLIKSGENFKIGRSDNLERRVKQINIALPEAASLFHAIQTDDPVGIEEYWHKRFADRRLNGEWFKLTKTDIAAFKRRKFQ
jgi:Meiotically up-regulated gene 113